MIHRRLWKMEKLATAIVSGFDVSFIHSAQEAPLNLSTKEVVSHRSWLLDPLLTRQVVFHEA